MQTLTQPDVDEQAVVRAVRRVELDLRNTRIEPRDIPDRVLAWRRDGKESDPRREVWDGLPKVNAATLSPVMMALHPAPVAIALVGPLEEVELDGLAFVAKPERIEP